MAKKSNGKPLKFSLGSNGFWFIIILIAAGTFWWYRSGTGDLGGLVPENLLPSNLKSKTEESEPVIQPVVVDRLPLAQGEQTFRLSHGDKVTGPRLSEVVISELDPSSGQQQTFTATITNDTPVTLALLSLKTDNQTTDYPMQLIDGSDTNGTWSVTLTTSDTHEENYYAKFILESSSGDWSGGLTFR
jgi:hypothetical protein